MRMGLQSSGEFIEFTGRKLGFWCGWVMEEDESSTSSKTMEVAWRPRALAFRNYIPPAAIESNAKIKPLQVSVRKPLVVRLTKDIVEIYQSCNPQFRYSDELNPKRFLTSPSTGLLNDGCDNANSDLILIVNQSLVNSETNQRYIVKDMLGHGTFGQVAKCWVAETSSFVAVKIIKNLPAYYQQALVEVSILTTLNKKFDPEDKHHIVRIYDYFVFQRHLCITFELLDTNLYELIKLNQFRGLSLNIVQLFSKQILRGLALMRDAGIIHCDLKPENILLCTSVKPPVIKIIDFGSACMEDRTVYSYIQSRYYRSPEVLLGYQYTTAIDMWSFGCIVAELFLGLPLFPGASEFDLLSRMIKILGGQPPDYILRKAKNTSKFFKFTGSINHEEQYDNSRSDFSMYNVLTEEEYAARESKKPSIGKEYFNHMNLEAIVKKYPFKKNLAEEDFCKESQMRLALIDFLRGLVEFDPSKRWSPLQASRHPFVTGEPFTCPYTPAPETPRMSVSQNVKVDHHPAGGHWFAAGLSPNISGRNRGLMPNSPHYQFMAYAHPGSYGSLGSHGSYNDGIGPGTSYGSYGDSTNYAFQSPAAHSGMNYCVQNGISILGSSPNTMHIPLHGNGVGFSPGNFVPMSLGSSPSQFTPPSSYNHMSAGSPGQYGPLSPVRGNSHGSPLGKMATNSHYNTRRKNTSSSYNQSEGNSPFFVGSPSHRQSYSNSTSTWRPQQGGRSVTSGYFSSHSDLNSSTVGVHMPPAEGEKSGAGNSLPDPGDWDPNYSEELLLQEDNLDVQSMTGEFSKGMALNQPLVPNEPFIGVGRSNRVPKANASMQRHEVPSQSFSLGNSSSLAHGNAHITRQSHLMPQSAQMSPSRLGQQQQPHQRHHNLGRSAPFRGNDWSQSNVHPPESGYRSGGPHSTGSKDMQWERKGNHSVSSASSYARKDRGRNP